jgi:hypothetical protein
MGSISLAQNKVEVVKSLYSVELNDYDFAFIFLGYSSILLRSKNLTIAIDPGKSLTQLEVSVIKHFDLLFFTHTTGTTTKTKKL